MSEPKTKTFQVPQSFINELNLTAVDDGMTKKHMRYIKIDYSRENIEDPYIYFIELNKDRMEEREVALTENGRVVHKITSNPWNGNLRWEFWRFTEDEIEKNEIKQEEFFKYWNK